MKWQLNMNNVKQSDISASPKRAQSEHNQDATAAMRRVKAFDFDSIFKRGSKSTKQIQQPSSLCAETRGLLNLRNSFFKSHQTAATETAFPAALWSTSERRDQKTTMSPLRNSELTMEGKTRRSTRSDYFLPHPQASVVSPRTINQDQEQILVDFMRKRNSITQSSVVQGDKQKNNEDFTIAFNVNGCSNISNNSNSHNHKNVFNTKKQTSQSASSLEDFHSYKKSPRVEVLLKQQYLLQPVQAFEQQELVQSASVSDMDRTQKLAKDKLVIDRKEASRGRKEGYAHWLSRNSHGEEMTTTKTLLSGETSFKSRFCLSKRSPMKGLSLSKRNLHQSSAYNITSLDPTTQHISNSEINALWSQLETEESPRMPNSCKSGSGIHRRVESLSEFNDFKQQYQKLQQKKSHTMDDEKNHAQQRDRIIEVSAKLMQCGLVKQEELTAFLDKKIGLQKYFMRTDIDEPHKIQTFRKLLNAVDTSRSQALLENQESTDLIRMLSSLQSFYLQGNSLIQGKGNSTNSISSSSILYPHSEVKQQMQQQQQNITSAQTVTQRQNNLAIIAPSALFKRAKCAVTQRDSSVKSLSQLNKMRILQNGGGSAGKQMPFKYEKMRTLKEITDYVSEKYKLR